MRNGKVKRYVLFGAIVAVVAVIALYFLSAYVFFKIEKIEVTGADGKKTEFNQGSANYLDEDVIRISGVRTGDSLVRTSKKDIEERIETLLPYIGSVTVKKTLPSTLKLIVADTTAYYALEKGGAYSVLDKTFKSLGDEAKVPEGCIKVTGVSLMSDEAGYTAKFNDDSTRERLAAIVESLDNAGIKDVSSISMSNIANIQVVINGRITFVLGSVSDIDDKISLGVKTMEAELALNPEAHIIINLNETGKSYVRDDPSPIEGETLEEDANLENENNDDENLEGGGAPQNDRGVNALG